MIVKTITAQGVSEVMFKLRQIHGDYIGRIDILEKGIKEREEKLASYRAIFNNLERQNSFLIGRLRTLEQIAKVEPIDTVTLMPVSEWKAKP